MFHRGQTPQEPAGSQRAAYRGECFRATAFSAVHVWADKLVLKDAVPELVELAFGRIKIVDGHARAVHDEPFALKAAENNLRMMDSDFMETTDWWMQEANNASTQGFAWELTMMNVLIEAFQGKRTFRLVT
ncbi:hypothetical protein BGX30_006320 [Mortierella sp. GBA39]|nr:hypothetical protein BGX30_006320 [Mortierella sp. GBA39]